ncbi:MAG TPA: tetratricopeptide repeat protein [Bacteroidales bacterium]|nr:tetratricopeptide repeat protein [Bacteroidales bacterium]
MAKKETKIEELESVGRVLSSSEAFIEKNQKSILIGVAIVVLIVLGIMAFRNFYQKPRELAAENAMYKAQEYFAIDSFRVAYEGDGAQVMGFKEIASEYGMTKSGELASAYSGICLYHMGKYQEAIKHLTQYNGKDNYFKTSIVGLIGDCYAELGDNGKAQNYYKKAISEKNDLAPIYLKKSGILFESENKNAEAEKAYQQIKDDYPMSNEAYDIDKYLARVQG